MKFTPSNTVFMFDVDGVLIKRGFWHNWQEYWGIVRDCNFFDILKFAAWQFLNIPSLLYNGITQDISVYLDELAKEWPFLQKETSQGTIIERIKRAISRSKPLEQMQEILFSLHAQGYPITLATNQSFSILKRIIDAGILPEYSYYSLIFTSDRCMPDHLIKKPRKKYYQCFKNVLAQTGLMPTYYIFIDDTYENVTASARQDIISIYVNNYRHNPAQHLIEDLGRLGIFVIPSFAKEKGREKFPAL